MEVWEGDDGLILCFLDHTAPGWASYVGVWASLVMLYANRRYLIQ